MALQFAFVEPKKNPLGRLASAGSNSIGVPAISERHRRPRAVRVRVMAVMARRKHPGYTVPWFPEPGQIKFDPASAVFMIPPI